MRRLADQVLFRAVRLLKDRPAAFRFAKRHLANTFVHRMAQGATRNVDARAASERVLQAHGIEPTAGVLAGHWDRNVARVESKELKGWLDWEFIEVAHILSLIHI